MIQFTLALVERVSGPAAAVKTSLAAAVSKTKLLESQMKSLNKELDVLRVKQERARASGLAGAAESYGRSIFALRMRMKGLGDELKESRERTKQLKDQSKNLSASFAQLGEAIGPVVAVLLAYGAALAGVAYVLFQGAKLAIASAEFKEQSLMSFKHLTGSARVGREVLGIIRDLEKSVPEAESTLVERAKGLLAQGLDPSKLKATLLDLSNVSAALGDEAGSKLGGIIEKTLTQGKFKLMPKQLVGTGITEADLARQLGMTPAVFEAMMKAGAIGADRGLNALHAVIDRKMGGAAKERLGTLAAISNKVGDSLAHIFEDVKIQPFIDGLQGIVGLLDLSTGSGQTFKWVVEQIFNRGFKESGGILLAVKHGIQDLIIAGLKLYIALKPTITEFKKLWEQAKESKLLQQALHGLGIVIKWLAIGIGITVAAWFAFQLAVVGVVVGVSLAVGILVSKVASMVTAIAKWLMSLHKIATAAIANFIMGLTAGIDKGIAKVKGAVSKLAAVMPKTLADKLEMHSPSRVAERQGEQFPEGAARGVARGAGRAASAVSSLSDRMAAAGPAGAGGAAAGGGKGQITIERLEVINQGVGSTGEAIELTATAIAKILEKIALSQGLQVAIGTTSSG